MSVSRLLTSLLFVYVLSTTEALEGTISLSGSNSSFPGLQGSTATFVCGWSFDSTVEFATGLTFSSIKRPNIYSYAVGNAFQILTMKGANYDENRMSTSPVNQDVSSVTLTLSDLGCDDGDTYTCALSWSLSDGTQQPNRISEADLVIQVPPSAPVVTVLSGDLTAGAQENDEIVHRCSANVGSSGKGRLHWRIYRGDMPEDIVMTDQRVSTSTTVPQDSQSCTEAITSDLTMRVSRTDQDLVVTCFVSNDDFAPASNLPVACEDNRLCDQTQRIHILYPVSENYLTVTHDPQTVYHGGSVTLTCRAEGFPTPTIMWVKDNETLGEGEADGNGVSRLVLTNLTVDGSSGVYTCVASNQVLGVPASANKSVDITVSATQPPPTDPPTTPTVVPPPDDNGEAEKSSSGGGDDNTTIIIVVVIVVVVVVVAVIVGVIFYRRRNAKKDVEEQPRKPTNNASNNLAFVNGVQPDLVADEKYRTPSLNNSFDVKNEDGLMYADLTYDNRPRSRKPLALGDNTSDYSDVQMPHV